MSAPSNAPELILTPVLAATPGSPYPHYHIEPRSGDRVLLADYALTIRGQKVPLDAGFRWQASVPRAGWSIINRDELGTRAPMGHDHLYRKGGLLPDGTRLTRAEVDALFYWTMIEEDVPEERARAAYTAVRAAGGSHWRGA